jgi:hypothetical protein
MHRLAGVLVIAASALGGCASQEERTQALLEQAAAMREQEEGICGINGWPENRLNECRLKMAQPRARQWEEEERRLAAV